MRLNMQESCQNSFNIHLKILRVLKYVLICRAMQELCQSNN